MCPQVMDWLEQTYTAHSGPLNASRSVNMFAETQIQDAKSKSPVALFMHPGTAPFANLGTQPVVAFTTMGGFVYALTTDALWKIDHRGTATYLGATSVSSNGCSVDNNGTTITWVDGDSGWIHTDAAGVRQITDPNWYVAQSVVYYDGYFVYDRKGTQQFFLSPLNWNGTDPWVVDSSLSSTYPNSFSEAQIASKEGTSDLLVAVTNSHEQLFLFGEKRTEVWYDAGNTPPTFPFQRSYGALIQRGLMAPYAFVLEDNTIFFLGDDLIFYRLNGFVPERQSNHAIEAAWGQYPSHRTARAITYTIMGHKMIALTFPSGHATWVLDLTTKRWHERESWTDDNAQSSIGRWRVNCALNSSSSIEQYPEVLVGDSLSGRIDQLNYNVFTEFGATMRALLIGPPVHADRRRVFMRRFEIDVETGAGAPYTQQVLNQFCPAAITMTSPAQIATAGPLLGVAATFNGFVFSDWVYLPDDAATRGLRFGNSSMSITIANNNSSPTTGHQIVVRLKDAAGVAILDAEYNWTVWTHWVWIGITCWTPTNQIQCWVSTSGYGDTQLTAAVLTWSSTHPIANGAGDSWQLLPASL
jgi:hypothetical protein